MIRKPLIQKYIHVRHPQNWNTHNHHSTESPQNTQNAHSTLKYTNKPNHWNSLGNWYTQTAQPREALRPLISMKYPDQIHWNMQPT